jgi:hypothetical protein
MFKKILVAVLLLLVVSVTGLAGFAWWKLQPRPDLQPLPEHLIAVESDQGLALLERASARADYEPLSTSFVPQKLISYCGVASGVTVLNAMGRETNQSDFFTPEASAVRERRKVMFGGMSLPDLGGLLAAHGARVVVRHADDLEIDDFRSTVLRNLNDPDDYLLVNYQREVLGQGRVGHISPIAAYDAESDRVLVMDTASYRYPPTWVPLPLLLEAMDTIDGASGLARGYVEVYAGMIPAAP